MSESGSTFLLCVVVALLTTLFMSLVVTDVLEQRDALCLEVYALSPTASDSLRISFEYPHCTQSVHDTRTDPPLPRRTPP